MGTACTLAFEADARDALRARGAPRPIGSPSPGPIGAEPRAALRTADTDVAVHPPCAGALVTLTGDALRGMSAHVTVSSRGAERVDAEPRVALSTRSTRFRVLP